MPDKERADGVLYVVATPIGNLDDISSRARAVLGDVALIAAEDTRRTRQLLRHFAIDTPLLALHEHNESHQARQVLARLAAGDSVALVSDAGTPLISDPGFRLVVLAREQGRTITAVPGCCAAIAALSIAGLATSRFHFEGFLPARAAARETRLRELAGCFDTLVFYEAVHRIAESLSAMERIFGAERAAFVARELTKLHETTYHGTLNQVLAAVRGDPGGDKGEFTVVVAGADAQGPAEAELARVVGILAESHSASDAATLASRLTGAPRRDAYRLAASIRSGKDDD